jgi:SAM-dependent methyltransferase
VGGGCAPKSGIRTSFNATKLPKSIGIDVMNKRLVITQGYPFPDLIVEVAEQDTMLVGEDFAHYLSVGVSALTDIRDALAISGIEARTILDMPCGFGRVTRALRAAYPEADICVSDIDSKALEFCARTFGAMPLQSQSDFAALNFRRKFDLIWVGSLITHLPADATCAFLRFVLRHLSPRGVALLSSHGAFVAGKFRGAAVHAQVLSDFFRTGYGFADYPETDISVQRYGNSIVSREWLSARISDLRGKVLFYRDHSWDNHHDVVAFRKTGGRAWSFFLWVKTAISVPL